jgi:D-alanyl-lipoteichoic acid acyltransferase DltB (MBOAT superfamily)
MLYNSLTYLVFFTVVFLATWGLRGHRPRLVLLLAASWLFYAAWYPRYLALFILVTGLTYVAGRWIGGTRERAPVVARWVLVAAIGSDLAMLAFFKYADFGLQSAAALANHLGADWHPPHPHIVLPLGISFYSFQSIAYLVDVFRGEFPPIRNPLKLALFKAFFPQLIAGPIVRAEEFLPQMSSARRFDPAVATHGLDLVASGLFKKVLIADMVAPFVDQVFAGPREYGSLVLLLGTYAYAAQIYCDFSGYTDIGRGCAYLLGYELPRNFAHPYFSVNIIDFWRRWHMTLSRWLRDYLYIPLGGGRGERGRTYRNQLITMTLGGLWHGASWTFVIWGVYHGLLLAATRFAHGLRGVKGEQPLFTGRAYRVLATLLTFHLVCIGWVFFRAPDFATALAVLAGIARFHPLIPGDVAAFGYVTLGVTTLGLSAAAALHALTLIGVSRNWASSRAWAVARPAAYTLVAIGILLLAGRGAKQFIYFQF